MNFGKIDCYMLLGAGQPLFNMASWLVEKEHRVLVVTSPRHVGEDLVDPGSGFIPLLDALNAYGVEYHVTPDANQDETVKTRVTKSTLGISIGSAWIFTEKFIASFGGRLVNAHCSRLPFHRGGPAGYSWDILDGSRAGGANIHLIVRRVNAGDIVTTREFTYPAWCKKPIEYQAVAAEQGTQALKEFVEAIEAGSELQPIRQGEQFSRFWPQLNTKVNGFVDWSWTLEEIESFICAFDEPYVGASTFMNGRRVHLKDCYSDHSDGTFHPFKSGIIYRKLRGLLFIAHRDGTLVVNEVTDEAGESAMPTIRLGDRLYTPRDVLEGAMQNRPVYTGKGLDTFPDQD